MFYELPKGNDILHSILYCIDKVEVLQLVDCNVTNQYVGELAKRINRRRIPVNIKYFSLHLFIFLFALLSDQFLITTLLDNN